MKTTSIVSTTAPVPLGSEAEPNDIWWTCPAWCAVPHQSDVGELPNGDLTVTHTLMIVDEDLIDIICTRDDVLGSSGVTSSSDEYMVSLMGSDYATMTPEQARKIVPTLNTFASRITPTPSYEIEEALDSVDGSSSGYRIASFESKFSPYLHELNDEAGSWQVALVAPCHAMSLVDARAYLADCAAIIAIGESLNNKTVSA